MNQSAWAAALLVGVAIAQPASGHLNAGKAAPVRPDRTMAAPIIVPPLAHESRTLANGVRVFTMRDPSSPVASVHLWYLVGQRDDPRGRGGFAHLFEHLMFRTTRNLPDGVHDFVTSRGGQTNASTLFDYTSYYVQAPANQLEALLWMEGERLRNLVIDEESFAAERGVVKQELNQRIYSAPYGRILYTLLPAHLYENHPYARPIGGTSDDLDRASLDDVRAFHQAYYRPDNLIMVVSGNFDPAQLERWIDLHIGSIPRPAAGIPRDPRKETSPFEAETIAAYAPNVPLPALVFAWRAPPADHADAAALALIESLLTRGASARLRRALVDEQGVASSVTSFNLPARDGHAFALMATLAPGKTIEQAQSALEAEMERLRDTLIDPAALETVKAAMLGDALGRRETPRGRAFELGGGVALTGDPNLEDRRLAAIQRLTPQEVREAARRQLDPSKRLTLHYRDESRKPEGFQPARGADISQMGTIIPPASAPRATLAATEDRKSPPDAGPSRPREIADVTSTRLPSGVRLIHARTSDVPLTTIQFVIDGGDSQDPAGRAGRADLAVATAMRGSAGLDAAAISTIADRLGGSIRGVAGPDAVTIGLTAPTANADSAIGLLAGLVMAPSFEEAELERVREQQIAALTVSLRQPVAVALRTLSDRMFGDSPYGTVPTVESLKTVSRADLVALQRRAWTPDRVALVVTGSLSREEALALARRHLGRWRGKAELPLPADPAGPPVSPQIVAVDLPGAAQSAVVAALAVPGRGDPRWPALQIAAARLGGGQGGFLNQEIRVERGLAYGAGSMFDERRDTTLLLAATQTRNDAVPEVVDLVLGQFQRLSSDPIEPEAARERASYVTNALASQTETSAGFADYLAGFVASGVPVEQGERRLAGIEKVDPVSIQGAVGSLIRPDQVTFVVAGDTAQWVETLRQRYPDLVRIDASGTPFSGPPPEQVETTRR